MTEPARTEPPIYLDNHATTPCDPRVVAVMRPFFEAEFANPHSAEHAPGRRVAQAMEHARAEIAALIDADPREIVITSGATEANNIAIKGAARHALRTGDPRRRIVTLATEHPCVLESVRSLAADGFEPVILPVGRDGLADPDAIADALRTPTLLISVMAANNETGVLQDLEAIAALARQAGAALHSDLAQAAGKVRIPLHALDCASLSAHKLHGPKGVGALWVRRRPRMRLEPLFSGGGQERGLRSGTLPSALVAGFGEAARIARLEGPSDAARLEAARDGLLHTLRDRIPGLELNGTIAPGRRLPGNLNIAFPRHAALDIMRRCPELILSTGSACSSAEITPSTVLIGMGLGPDRARRSLRAGLGRFTSAAELQRAADMLAEAFDELDRADHPIPAPQPRRGT